MYFPFKTTALITGEIQYFSFLGALTNLYFFFDITAVELLVYFEAIILRTTSMLAVGDMVKSSPGPESHTCRSLNWLLLFLPG